MDEPGQVNSTGSVRDWDNGRPGLQEDKNYSCLSTVVVYRVQTHALAANGQSSSRSTIFKALKLLEQLRLCEVADVHSDRRSDKYRS